MARKPGISVAILDVMRKHDRHAWTLEDLHGALAERRIAADFSSVFRAAEKLAGGGVIRKLVLDDGRARFELIDAHHDHLHCTRCGELVPVPCPIGPDEFAAIEREAGIAILGHHLVLSGLCRDCRMSPGKGEQRA
jgi:Fur family transcriptional regulator, ferric uptake regulator